MRIKSLHLRNIRSYADEKIDFPSGKILFEGDIGSGKSTILLGIEFALFGLSADISGQNLLRAGQNRGEATLVFESEGKEYKIHRAISKKTKGIVQDAGYIIFDSQRLDFSPDEMRSKILQILKFNESLSSRSSSKIFRYAIFTPQEEVKNILNLKPAERLETLRKAFGVEEYSTAKENSQLIIRKLKSIIDVKSGLIDASSGIEQDIKKSKEMYSSLQIKSAELSKQLESRKSELENIEKQILEVQTRKEELASLQSRKNSTEQALNSAKIQLETQKTRIAKIKIDLEKLTAEMKNSLIAEKPKLTKTEMQNKNSELLSLISKLQLEQGKLQSKLDNYNFLVSKKVCPTCEREIQESDFGGKIKQLELELAENSVQIADKKSKLKELEEILRAVQEYELKQTRHELLKKQIEDKTNQMAADSTDTKRHEAEILNLASQLQGINSKLLNYQNVSDLVFQLTNAKKQASAQLNYIISEHSSSVQKSKDLEEKITELETKQKSIEKIKEEKEKLTEKLLWLRDFFVPCLDLIEQHVMISLNSEFDNQFKFWFELLMETSEIKVGVDEEFTPLVEQNNYTLDVTNLSGGEKTSVALAYRLALNSLVKRVCSSLKSNLLIMDEPTDGFSKEQLFKIKDVLDELKCEQTILVSHERELESFVDTIFRIVKKDHISKVEKIS